MDFNYSGDRAETNIRETNTRQKRAHIRICFENIKHDLIIVYTETGNYRVNVHGTGPTRLLVGYMCAHSVRRPHAVAVVLTSKFRFVTVVVSMLAIVTVVVVVVSQIIRSVYVSYISSTRIRMR